MIGIRADLRQDGEVCEACLRLLADSADLRRVITRGRVDVLAICTACRQPNIIVWASEGAS